MIDWTVLDDSRANHHIIHALKYTQLSVLYFVMEMKSEIFGFVTV